MLKLCPTIPQRRCYRTHVASPLIASKLRTISFSTTLYLLQLMRRRLERTLLCYFFSAHSHVCVSCRTSRCSILVPSDPCVTTMTGYHSKGFYFLSSIQWLQLWGRWSLEHHTARSVGSQLMCFIGCTTGSRSLSAENKKRHKALP